MVFKDSIKKSLLDKIQKFKPFTSDSSDEKNDWKISKDDLDALLESFVDKALNELGINCIISAQDLFFQKTGKAFTDDVFFDTRINYFFDCFLYCSVEQYNPDLVAQIYPSRNIFEYMSLRQFDMSKNQTNAENQEHRPTIRPTHSIFKILKIDSKSLYVRDTLSKATFQVQCKDNQSFIGISKSSYLQGFIFPCTEGNIINSGYFAHPNTCSNIIKQAIQKIRKNQIAKATMLEKLAFAQIKHFRLKHVCARKIYRGHLLDPR